MVVAAVLGLILDVVVVGVLCAVMLTVLWHFGPAQPAGRRCPACQRDGLGSVIASTVAPGRLTILQCAYCNAAYREQLDGSLAVMTDPV